MTTLPLIPATWVHWAFLALAILLEVTGTTALRLSAGFTKPLYVSATFLLYGVSFFFLAKAMVAIPTSISYAIWSGVGTALIVLIGVFLFQEVMTTVRMVFISMIIIGVVGLQLVSNQPTA